MAGTTRLELATSAVTGQRSNQLNYVPKPVMKTCRQALWDKAAASSQAVRSFVAVLVMTAVPAKTPYSLPTKGVC